MKKNTIKTLMATLGLSTSISLLGGCGDTSKQIYVGDIGASKITYNKEANLISGSISYENLEKGYLKIATLEYNGKELEPKLKAIYFYKYRPVRGGGGYDTINYIDLESGVTQITYLYPNYYNEKETPEITIGENFTIIEEISLFDFIIENNWLQDEYDINELIKFFEEIVKPELESQTEIKNREKVLKND